MRKPTSPMDLTRCYSDTSAGALSSGKGSNGPSQSLEMLLCEFSKHRIKKQTSPTSLVSVSDRILDTLKRAFNKYYEGERPEQIMIVFIKVPSDRIKTIKIHSAKNLAEHFCPEPRVYSHEYVFEWAIPPDLVVHTVSVKTLLDRGLALDKYRRFKTGRGYILPRVRKLKQLMADDYFPNSWDGWDVGTSLGIFARPFGARAPVHWIARQFYFDVIEAPWVDCDGDVHSGTVSYTNGTRTDLEPGILTYMEDGIRTALVEWWFLDDDFVRDLKAHGEWMDIQRDLMAYRLISFAEDWPVHKRGSLRFHYAKAKLEELEIRDLAAMEQAAVEIGL
ncbi:hypothetical protein Purlil1_9639 [Purpureocillium lilacinum]|uniref:DUF7587 domain-containing protein n=1 Tax=Purpureocillium lilacinum TaxID=33203 RepID=A0ABR0BQ06_PURLI|nr:hypothetical protein Purlil1_9639 [Purpureocillium lilacinum]